MKKSLLWIWQYLKTFAKLLRRPKVRNSILGILAFLVPFSFAVYIYLEPDIDVVFTDPLDSKDIFTSYFTIKNNGNSNIYNVRYDHFLNNIKASSKMLDEIRMNDNSIINRSTTYKRIASKDKRAIQIDFLRSEFGGNVYDGLTTFQADLEIHLHYEYWDWMKKTDTLKFTTSKMINNKVIWLQVQ